MSSNSNWVVDGSGWVCVGFECRTGLIGFLMGLFRFGFGRVLRVGRFCMLLVKEAREVV
jgi:hypothetical protein